MTLISSATCEPPPRAMAVEPSGYWKTALKWAVPLAVGTTLSLLAVPDGLTPNAWHYFALFAAVMVAIITEPLPPAVIGLVGVVAAAALGLVRDSSAQSVQWALSGFSNPTIWLIFAAYMFALGYSKSGLGERISLWLILVMGRKTLGLGYAIALADFVLAPFMPSNTARSGGTIYPVIRNIPELYGSMPYDPSSRKLGAYLMYTALASTCITSSMFLTSLAPNVLAMGMVSRSIDATISWTTWFLGFAPVGFLLFLTTPLLLYWIFPPEIKEASEAPTWAKRELYAMGPFSRKERLLLMLVVLALGLWIGAPQYLDAALSGILIVVLMTVLGVVSWNDIIGNAPAWNVLIWFGTLVTLANGLAETKFIDWIAHSVAPMFSGHSIAVTILLVIGSFYLLHYFFASVTAHVSALFSVFLGVAISIAGVSGVTWSLLLGYTLGIMGIITPYGTGPSPIYYGSGYIQGKDFWRLGLFMGAVFFLAYIIVGIPWLLFLKL